MIRLNAVLLEQDERAVLRALGQAGVVQLVHTRAGDDTAPLAARNRSADLARCDQLLARVEELRRSLEIPPGGASGAGLAKMTLDQAAATLRLMEERTTALQKRRQARLQRWGQLGAACEQMANYRGLEIPLDEPDRFSFLHFVTGTLPTENLVKLQQSVGENVALLPLAEHKGRQPLIAMTTLRGRLDLEHALQELGFQRESLPAVEGATVDTQTQENEREREQLAAELASLDAELRTLATDYASSLAEIEGWVTVERQLLEAEQCFPRTEATVLLSGWVPANKAQSLVERLRTITGSRCVVETTAPGKLTEEQAPVLLQHPRLLRPFEMLVTAYGLPKYEELEPTLFVALSYVLMFGMMFGDVGHGALLALGGLVALLAGRKQTLRDAGLLLLCGGLSSMVFGFVYGSCFGLEPFKKYALWHEPLEGDPMRLMFGAIGIGMVMISLGLVLNVINRFRRGDVIGGLLDKFGVAGMVFYWGALAIIAKYAVIQSRGLVTLALVVFLGLPLAGWVLKEPIEYFLSRRAGHPIEPGGGLFAAIMESLVGAFEGVLSYLANTISFVRLAAYAMSHAALLVAAFMLAGEVKHLRVGGDALSVIVIILGNLIAIVLEGIIASVQALRLEYYEFFGKFFVGGGQPFTPFRLITDEQT